MRGKPIERFRGGIRSQRQHLNELVDSANDHENRIQKLERERKRSGRLLVLAVQDAVLIELEVVGRVNRAVE